MTGLSQLSVTFVIFGGKGGVGKTTMASAMAVQYAKQNPEKKVLLFTTDPAPSLSDSVGQQLSFDPMPIKGVPNLWAMEISAEHELEKFKQQYGHDILDILQEGTYLSDDEAESMFTLDIPGLDEVMGLKKIMDFMGQTWNNAEGLARSNGRIARLERDYQTGEQKFDFDMYILDAAPTGHTLRLLALPELLDNWIKFLAKLRWKYHYMVDRFSKNKDRPQNSADDFLLEMKKTVTQVRKVLVDFKKTTFVVVMVPEAMVISETNDLLAELKRLKISVQSLIINHVFPEDASEFVKARRKSQQAYIQEFRQSHPALDIIEIEEHNLEVRGIKQLASIGKKLI